MAKIVRSNFYFFFVEFEITKKKSGKIKGVGNGIGELSSQDNNFIAENQETLVV